MSGLRAQRSWWNEKAKPFRLMTLPPEIRAIVLDYILGSVICPVRLPLSGPSQGTSTVEKLHIGHGYNKKLYYALYMAGQDNAPVCESGYMIPCPNLSILGVSRQIQSEALHGAWTKLFKYFFLLTTFKAVVTVQTGPALKYAYNPAISARLS